MGFNNMGKFSVLLMMVMMWCWASMAEAEYMLYKDPKQPQSVRINDLLKRMTLEEKIGQMTQIEKSVATKEVMKKYLIGSVLSAPVSVFGGGSGLPKQAPPEMWVNMVNDLQKGSLSTRLGIPYIHGIDAVHGHNAVYRATIFPHNSGLGVTRQVHIIYIYIYIYI
ncbi:putative glucan 1,3-beta-glucosidase [Helianthus annuus]|nr:putative glucan 1,3-beta-glucosidase [Helianthus annuus]KAJ0793740.1 putative glucan 1,3-beta-glucosidase [Helianthus annuus]